MTKQANDLIEFPAWGPPSSPFSWPRPACVCARQYLCLRTKGIWTDLLASVLILSSVGCQALGEWRGSLPPAHPSSTWACGICLQGSSCKGLHSSEPRLRAQSGAVVE